MLIEVEWNPDRRQLRSFGWVMLAGFPLFGALLAWRFSSWTPLVFCAALGYFCWTTALFAPAVGLWVYKIWMGIGYAMGMVVAPIAISAIYFLVVTPIALALRLMGKDPMQRRRRGAPSYWLPVKHRTAPDSYRRQF